MGISKMLREKLEVTRNGKDKIWLNKKLLMGGTEGCGAWAFVVRETKEEE
jgi:hypothetical protein